MEKTREELFTEIFETTEYYKIIKENPTREKLLIYIFDRLEANNLTNYTKMYNRELILNSYVQTKAKPYEFANKTQASFSQGVYRVLANKIFNKNKGTSWDYYLLNIIGFKRCPKCGRTLKLEEFNKSKNRNDGVSSNCRRCCKGNYDSNKESILQQKREYYKNNIDEINEKRHKVLLAIFKEIEIDNKGIECLRCGYKENWAALEFHHINSELERPDYSYNSKTGEKRRPADYILGCKKVSTAIERYNNEKYNLELICSNCHQKEHATSKKNNQEGLHKAYSMLEIDYVCQSDGCNENKYLHIHHVNTNDKEVSNRTFTGLSYEKILMDGLLKKELEKDVKLLCANHHKEIHNPNRTVKILKGDK